MPMIFSLATEQFSADKFQVRSFSARERLSRPYSVSVTFASPVHLDELLPGVIGRRVALAVNVDGAERLHCGIVRDVHTTGELLGHDLTGYRLTIVPSLDQLAFRRDSRIFQGVRADAVVTSVLDALRLAHRWQVRWPLPIREYITQFQETDLRFIHRLLADAGIAYYFEQPSGGLEGASVAKLGETMVMFDDVTAYPKVADSSSPSAFVLRRDFGQKLTSTDELRRVTVTEGMAPEAATYRAYDMVRPNIDLRSRAGRAQADRAAMEIYAHSRGALSPDWDKDQREASLILERARRDAHVIRGEGISPAFRVGHRFKLEDEVDGRLDGEYVVVGLRRQGKILDANAARDDSTTYRHRFLAVPADVCYRPRRSRRRRVHSCVNARVVGPPGEELFVDPHGQVKVQFHWDRLGKGDEKSSCWIRVAQPWAGAQWGAQFLPRVGAEVVVAFEDGDADRPVIIGQLYNGARPMPFDLKSRTKTGIISRTFGGPGANELYVDDARGAEVVQITAQRDHNVEVSHDHLLHVSGASTFTVGGRYQQSIGGGHVESVSGTKISTVSGERTDRTTGTWIHQVAGGIVQEAKGDFELRAKEQLRLTAATGLSMVVGSQRTPGHFDLQVTGSLVVGATETLSIRCDGPIELQCGGSSLVIGPSGIKIVAPKIDIQSAGGLSAKSDKGGALELTDSARVAAKKIQMFAPNASLALDDKGARLFGDTVQLDAAPEENKSDPNKDPEAKTKKLHVQLSNDDFKAYAKMNYHVLVDGTLLQGITDADGVVDKEVPESAKKATILLWPKDYPKGPYNKWEIDLMDEMPGLDTARGAKLRLKNLGYFSGPIDDEQNEAFSQALLSFQRDAGIPATGRLDPKTIDALEKYHNS